MSWSFGLEEKNRVAYEERLCWLPDNNRLISSKFLIQKIWLVATRSAITHILKKKKKINGLTLSNDHSASYEWRPMRCRHSVIGGEFCAWVWHFVTLRNSVVEPKLGEGFHNRAKKWLFVGNYKLLIYYNIIKTANNWLKSSQNNVSIPHEHTCI